ncbi:hypothetical protein [Sorangium cellulosum]|uniref:hypothetical protein n=1 Tax=Sorangium cellulosum TaxID=56 RepID=UPI0012DB403D|nr:hypothetical protein [Sorangium cellulosum]
MIHRFIASLIIVGAGVAGALIGRAVPHGEPRARAVAGASLPRSGTTAAADGCEAERRELGSARVQLALCMSLGKRDPESSTSEASEGAESVPPPGFESVVLAEMRRERERLDSLREAVIVQHADGTIGIYKPEDWPIDGDGLIVGRKLPSGQIGWYAGPDAGSRLDPAAFRRPDSTVVLGPNVVREADGTIRVRRDASPAVKRMFGVTGDEPARP